MPYGYSGKWLFIDLASQQVEEKELDEQTCRLFIGGTGLGAKVLYDNIPQGADPLGPENMLGFVTGPLTATGVPGGGRFTVVTKSPVTGAWADSNSGGFWGPELKRCGFDALFFSNVSAESVYVSIIDNQVTIKSAAHLWGKNTNETSDLIQAELNEPQCRVACIGPAGESLSLMSGIVNEKGRIAARGGVGAVMGSKRLKAIAVRSNQKRNIAVAKPEQLRPILKAYSKDVKESPFHQGLSAAGTGGGTSFLLSIGDCPTKNWISTGTESMETCHQLDSANMDQYKLKKYGCDGCIIRCGALIKVNEGPYATRDEIHRPEYETLAAIGPLCLNDNVEAVIKVNEICNLYGIDTIAMGGVIAFAIECYESGLITTQDTDGLDLKWGDADGIVALAEKIGRRDGFGFVLADGVKVASERIGKNSEQYAIHVGGHRLPFHDPRLTPSLGAYYISDSQPGCHMGPQGQELLEKGVDLGDHPLLRSPQSGIYEDYNKKGEIYATGSAYFQLLSSCGLCALFAIGLPIPLVELLAPVTGWNIEWEEGINTGKRILALRQAFNAREGIRPEAFRLPKRLVTPLKIGPGAGQQVDFKALKEAYFAEMGWDKRTGWPSKECLQKLGIAEMVGI